MAKKIKLVPKNIPSPFSGEDAMAILESLREEFGDKIVEKLLARSSRERIQRLEKKISS